MLSVILSLIFTSCFFPSSTDGSIEVRGNVTNASHTDDVYSEITLKTSSIDGRFASHSILIKGDKDSLSGVNIGDEVSMLVTVTDARELDMTDYYVSRGISAIGEEPSSVVIHSRGNYSLSHRFSLLRLSITERFRLISDSETGGFLSALITGERHEITPSANLSFKRAGLSHILALSGTHLVILAYAASYVLKLFRLNSKLRTVTVSVLVLGYMLLTGMSPCVVRAGIMMLINSALFLLSERSDGVTSLSISVFIILLFQPYAAFDISLWLSALATLGLIFLGTVYPPNPSLKLFKRLVRGTVCAFLASVFAIGASFIVSLLTFDSFSILSVPATVLISPLIQLLIYLGLFGLAFGGIIPMSGILTGLTELIGNITEWMARTDFALISFDYVPVKILSVCLTMTVFGFILFASRKTVKPILITVSSIFILLNLTGIICSAVTRYDDAVIFHPSADSNTVVIKSEGEIALIQSRSDPYYATRPDYICRELKLTSIDKYIVSGYSRKTVYDVTNLVKNVQTDELYLPSPRTDEEADVVRGIYQTAISCGTRIILYECMDGISVGEIGYTLVYSSPLGLTKNVQAYVLLTNGKTVTYISPDAASDINVEVNSAIDLADILIIGGRRYAYGDPIYLIPKRARKVVIGSDYYDTTKMELELKEKGVSVTVTDTPVTIFD